MSQFRSGPEQDVRVQILNSFLSAPHGKLQDLASLHRDALERDPLFYGHLAPWYFEHGEVRDHKVLFVAHLATSAYPEFRGAAWVLLQQLAPYEVARVLDHAKQVIGKTPRSLRSAIQHYLRTREANPRQLDRAALRARSALKHLYASLRLKPGPRAQALLFDEQPPADSPQALLKQLARAESAEEQARLIIEGGIPYTTAIGAVRTITPALLVALINAMSPQEVINALASLKRRGAFDHPEVKALIDQKLALASSDQRVSTMKVKKAIEAAQPDEATTRSLLHVADQRVANKVVIRRPTALFIDKSGSMTPAIELAKQLAALISAVIEAPFYVYAFDTAAFSIEPPARKRRPTLSDWEQAFKFVRAEGGTSIGAPLAKMTREQVYVEQILVVTDCGENTPPLFHTAWQEYRHALGLGPSVILVIIGQHSEYFERQLVEAGIEVTSYHFTGDYYSLPNLLPLLALPTRAELVDEIMAYPLPQRPLSSTQAVTQA
ncbi:vWA domain-containing protein [Thermogemmatispora onikobensis]|uniref:vWA domain-containing protein n=1 Tax=Thermogemmatispora onikobensis TaxID=732234 RepID=UPI000852B866|nr:vWA domain-containing protein [Thermogemmatispora onikobensis]